ncbi:hypothetical protein OEJ37_13685 [Burkholderia sp. BKH01]|uniref:hypothetical protein n=1 Tax=Burkholderia sp. BKH01 TaxID=2769262 RepID=UPI0021E01836|nr:hypothetical protein [Burkholderia sp. BKH01]MCU9954405.1 hypothetical protein [Burkholderia sp. BKH01]
MTGRRSTTLANQLPDFDCNLLRIDRQLPIRVQRGQLSPDAPFPSLTHVKVARAARHPPACAKSAAPPAFEARPALTAARREPHWNMGSAAAFARPFARPVFDRPRPAGRGNTLVCQDID